MLEIDHKHASSKGKVSIKKVIPVQNHVERTEIEDCISLCSGSLTPSDQMRNFPETHHSLKQKSTRHPNMKFRTLYD